MSSEAPRGPRRAGRWQRAYALRLLATDTLIVIGIVLVSQAVRVGSGGERWSVSVGSLSVTTTYTMISVALIVAWCVLLAVYGTREARVIGAGPAEYRRIVDATVMLFGAFAIAMFLLRWDVARAYILLALPVGLLVLLASRWCWRQWLFKRRRRGECTHRAILVGDIAKSAHVVEQVSREPGSGVVVVGAIVPGGRSSGAIAPNVPVLGRYEELTSLALANDVDTIILTGSDDLRPRAARELGWRLESHDLNLVVAPSLTDVAGPRIHARPVAGLPLIHVDYPKLVGRRAALKRFGDIVGSAFGLIVLSPLLIVLTVLVATSSPGGPFFRQERIGHHGRHFEMLKFRSMVVDAEEQLGSLLDQSDGSGVLFKMQDDPRVTKIGSVLRRYSLDELPQLVNVLLGHMSLVGPRPPLAREVEAYDQWEHRRLHVKPGLTGLWQVSGRSDLNWEDSIRLDLYYVENWSLTADITILFRTVRAVARSRGAY